MFSFEQFHCSPLLFLYYFRGFPCSSVSKESGCNAGDLGLMPESGRSPREGNGNPLQLPGESHGQRILAGCSPWGHKDSVKTENTHTHNTIENTYLAHV